MKLKNSLSFFLAILVWLSSLTANAAQESLQLSRNAATGSRLEGTLSRDVYRTVPYQDTYEEQEPYQVDETYTVEVPYQAEETYYVDVPYQEQESYLDTEYYYDNEYRCQTVTEYERECKTERLCSREPGDNICQEVEECGRNALGEPICKIRKVCNRGPDRENCRDNYTCRDVPRSREKCGYEQVKKSRTVTKWRTVTKYRQEARTRTVTKYRTETRTRTVTKYRTVTKCCVTRYREEYERTWDLRVQIQLPEQAILIGDEKEQFELNLKGTEAQPDVELRSVSTIFGYKIARKNISKGSGQIELALAPKYNDQSLGEKLIEKIELIGPEQDLLNEILVKDRGVVPRVTTVYRYRIVELQSQTEVAKGELSSTTAIKGVISGKLAQALPGDVDYIVQISATRSGIVLEKPISFELTRKIEFTRWNAEEFGTKSLKSLGLVEQKDQTKLNFKDEGAHPKLLTQYRVITYRKSGVQVATQDFLASEVIDINNQVSLVLDPKAMALSEDLIVRLLVQRTGRRLDKPVQFQKDLDRPYVSLEDLKDRKKVSGLSVEGDKSNIRLIFKDEILDSSRVTTEYTVVIRRNGGFLGTEKKVLLEAKLTQSQMRQGIFNEALINMGVRGKDLERHADSGSTLYIDLTAVRKSVVEKKTLATVRRSIETQVK